MNVAELQSFLRSLAGPLAVSGGKRIADDLERAAAGLGPFSAFSLAQFADFLARAEEYHRTGIVPGKAATRKRSGAAIDAEKVGQLSKKMNELYERAGSDAVDYSTIESEVHKLDKQLNKAEAVELARDFGAAAGAKTKKAALAAVQQRIADRKESVQRTRF